MTDAIERGFKSFAPTWPSWLSDSEPAARKAWQKLSDKERDKAVDRADEYLMRVKDTKKNHGSLAVYLREKRWEKLGCVTVNADKYKNYAAPFGTDWGIVRFCFLLDVAHEPVCSTEQLGLYARHKYPEVERMQSMARKSIGVKTPEKPPEIRELMEFVSVDYDMWQRWRDEHNARGWPWFLDVGHRRGAWFPKGGPDGLAAFERAVREN